MHMTGHHWELTDSRLPAANLGRSERPEWFPVSKLTTWPYQRLHCNPRDLGMSNNELLEFTRLSPIERASLMSHLVDDHISNGNADSVRIRKSPLYIIADIEIAFLESFSTAWTCCRKCQNPPAADDRIWSQVRFCLHSG